MKIFLAIWSLISPFIFLLEGIVIGILFCIAYDKWREIKGWFGEKVLWILLRRHLKRHDYKILNNIYLHQSNGYTHQIDHIVVSQWGIFVIETKTFDGELVQCNNEARRWTYVTSSNGYYYWQNPIKQNRWHNRAQADSLGHPLEHFYSIVAFAGPIKFPSKIPANVVHFDDVAQYIQSHSQTTIILPEIVQGLVAQIKALDKAVTKEQRKNHNKQCQERRKQKQATIKDTPPQPKASQVSTPQSSASVSTHNCQVSTNSVQKKSSVEVIPPSKPIIFPPKSLGGHLGQTLDNQHYRILPNSLKLPGEKDTTINYLILSEWGIFVIRHITCNGYIYHWNNGTKWKTQYANGQGFDFFNPLEQNNIHIMEWSRRLQLPPESFHSVIAFNDGATFKRDMPKNVMHFSKVSEYLRQHSQTAIFSQSQIETLANMVSSSKTS